jgi:hypothetical protein
MQEGLYARPEVSLGGCKSAADHYARGLERADATLARISQEREMALRSNVRFRLAHIGSFMSSLA